MAAQEIEQPRQPVEERAQRLGSRLGEGPAFAVAQVLERCSLVLFHGGSGTLGHVVAHGLPMVILPLAADQPENVARCAELGVSRSLDPDDLTPSSVRDIILEVLHTPSYRQSAERLREEFNSLPGPEFAVDLLERLARDKAPIIAAR